MAFSTLKRAAVTDLFQEWRWAPPLLAAVAAIAIGLVASFFAITQPKLSLALLGAPFFALMVRYPRYTLYLFVFGFPLTIGMPRGFGVPILRPGEALLIAAFAAIMLNRLLNYPWRVSFSPIDLGMLLLFVTGTLTPLLMTIWRGQTISTDNVNVMVGPIRFYMVYLMVRAALQERKHIKYILYWWLAASVVATFLGICQKYNLFGVPDFLSTYFMDASTREYIYDEWRNPDLFRITSVFSGSWNTMGSYIAFTLLMAIYYAETVRDRVTFLILCVVIAFDGWGLILSGNVSSTVGLIGGIFLGSIYLRRLPRAVIPLLIGAALASVFFNEFVMLRLQQQFGSTSGDTVLASSFTYRIQLWINQFLPALRGNELLGVGPDMPPEVWWGTEESQYLFLLYKGGILYLLGYLLWAGLAVGMCVLHLKHPDQLVRMLALPAALIIVGLMYMGISNAYATYSAPMANLWILLALVSSAGVWSSAAGEQQAAEHAPSAVRSTAAPAASL